MVELLTMPIRRWLIQLGKLTATRISTDEAASYIEANEPMLAMHFPPAAFTLESLEHVAAQCKHLPTYGEIVEHLGAWWKQRRPQLQAVTHQPSPLPEPHSAEERAHASWLVKQTTAALRSSAQPIEDRRKPGSRHLTQDQLVRAYQAAGVEPPKRSA